MDYKTSNKEQGETLGETWEMPKETGGTLYETRENVKENEGNMWEIVA